MKSLYWRTRHILGVPQHVPSWREQCAAAISAVLGIGLVAVVGWNSAYMHVPWLLTSMGATAVLVFAVPHGPLSQPWAVFMGHMLSAVAGLLVVHTVGVGLLAYAIAVGLAIAAMHVARCIHPPGGATALFVVQYSAMSGVPGWEILFNPVWLNVSSILLAAVVLNYPFVWRRYPESIAYRHSVQPLQSLSHEPPFSRQELDAALGGMDEMYYISDEQLQRLYEALVSIESTLPVMSPEALEPGNFYSNGLRGERWAVRQIIDANPHNARKPQVIVKTVAGQGRGSVQLMSRHAFSQWAKYPVYPDTGQWTRDKPDEV